MEIIYSDKAQKDRSYWKKSGNKAVMNKITALINDIQLHPFEGIGKPEPLKNINLLENGLAELTKNTGLFMKLLTITQLRY